MSGPSSDAVFQVTLGDVRAVSSDIPAGWVARGETRQWAVIGGEPGEEPWYRCSRRARLKWAAAEVWALHHDIDAGVSSTRGGSHPWCEDPARLPELEQWIVDQYERFDAFINDCRRALGDPDIAPLRPLPADVQDVGMVYLIHMPLGDTRWRNQERVKIGWVNAAEGVDHRLRQLQTGAPFPLVLIACFRGTRRCEAAMHRRFAKLRRQGEWFEFDWEIELAFRLLARDPTRRPG